MLTTVVTALVTVAIAVAICLTLGRWLLRDDDRPDEEGEL